MNLTPAEIAPVLKAFAKQHALDTVTVETSAAVAAVLCKQGLAAQVTASPGGVVFELKRIRHVLTLTVIEAAVSSHAVIVHGEGDATSEVVTDVDVSLEALFEHVLAFVRNAR